MTAYSSINSNGFAGLSAAGRTLRRATMLYNCEGRVGEDLQLCQAASVTNSQNQASYQSALDLITQRTTQIQALQGSINSTSDPKAIAELQARIASENAQITNDANRIALMRAIADSQDRLVQQQYRERELRSLNSTAKTKESCASGLRRHSRCVAGKRTVWPHARRLHGSGSGSHRRAGSG